MEKAPDHGPYSDDSQRYVARVRCPMGNDTVWQLSFAGAVTLHQKKSGVIEDPTRSKQNSPWLPQQIGVQTVS